MQIHVKLDEYDGNNKGEAEEGKGEEIRDSRGKLMSGPAVREGA